MTFNEHLAETLMAYVDPYYFPKGKENLLDLIEHEESVWQDRDDES